MPGWMIRILTFTVAGVLDMPHYIAKASLRLTVLTHSPPASASPDPEW